MAQYSFPFAGTTTGDAGPYTDSLFSQFLKDIFSQRTRINAGVFQDYNDGVNDSLEVTVTSPTSAAVSLHEGSALIQGKYYVNDADLTLPISANNDGSGWDRIDSVILRIDFTNQTVRAAILEGTAAASPVAPTLTQNSTIYEVRIANVTVPNLFLTITTGIDNSVRDYAQLLSSRDGGTGSSSYLTREKLMGQSDNTLTKAMLSSCSVNYDGTGATKTTASWQTIECSEEYDPDSLITVSSNQITFLKAGIYNVFGSISWNAVSSSNNVGFRLRDITNTATLTMLLPTRTSIAVGVTDNFSVVGRPIIIY